MRKEKEELKNNQSNNLNPAQSKRVQNLINQNFIKITFDEYNKEPEKYMGDIGWRMAKVGFKDPEGNYLDDDMYMMDSLLIQKNLDSPSEDTEG